MAQATNAIGSLQKLLAIRDELLSHQVVVDDIKQRLLSNKPLPPTFISDIEDLRTQRSHDLLTSQDHADMLSAHVCIFFNFFRWRWSDCQGRGAENVYVVRTIIFMALTPTLN